jgi:hypothetical protein
MEVEPRKSHGAAPGAYEQHSFMIENLDSFIYNEKILNLV